MTIFPSATAATQANTIAFTTSYRINTHRQHPRQRHCNSRHSSNNHQCLFSRWRVPLLFAKGTKKSSNKRESDERVALPVGVFSDERPRRTAPMPDPRRMRNVNTQKEHQSATPNGGTESLGMVLAPNILGVPLGVSIKSRSTTLLFSFDYCEASSLANICTRRPIYPHPRRQKRYYGCSKE